MKRIGPYIVKGLLGTGGMGRVYKVIIPPIDRLAAVKILSPHPHLLSLMGEPSVRYHFLREAQTMAKIRHRNIVPIWDIGQHQGKPYYLMDYVDNSLADLMGERSMPDAPSRILPILAASVYLKQVLSALDRLHQQGIVHRDIKPFNILINDTNISMICDFGLSLRHGEKLGLPKQLKVGSPWYAAPEQEIDPDRVDHRADLFSVGIMMYRMITGRLPMQKSADAASSINPELNGQWDRFLRRATAPKPDERYSSAREMIDSLDELVQRWRKQKDAFCESSPFSQPVVRRPTSVRQVPAKVPLAQALSRFELDKLFQPLERGSGIWRADSGEVLEDTTTGLIWQQSGSAFALDRNQADRFIDSLNTEKFAGFGHWRLPTVDEILTTLPSSGSQSRDGCVEPAFNARQHCIWSCDRCTFTSDWYVSVGHGFVARRDRHGSNYVRAVCNLK